MFHVRVAAVAALSLFVALPTAAKPSADQWDDPLPIRDAWLRDHMPAGALMYVRIPHPFGVLSTPKGSVLDPALRSEANVENLVRIRKGIVDNLLPEIPAFADIRMRLVEQYLRSPIEAAIFLAPAPSTLVSVNLDVDSNEALQDVLYAFGLQSADFGLIEPLGADGIGQINGLGMPTLIRFDASTGNLLIHAGPGASAEGFANLLSEVESKNEHMMSDLEQRVDASGQGFFYWINAEQALPAMALFVQPEDMQDMYDAGLDKVRAAAMGMGVANGKGRLSVVADVKSEDDRGFIPYISNDLSARSVGDPDALFVLSFPTAEEFSRLEEKGLALADDEGRQEWLEGKAEFAEMTGVTVEEIFRAVGPELMIIVDRAGDYAAVRVRDRRLWDSVVQRLSESGGRSPDQRRISGKTYYHIGLPNTLDLIPEEAAQEIAWWASLLARVDDHYYWTYDGDFLYMAAVPQVLIDRAAMRPRTDVGEWLAETQRIDGSEAFFSLSGRSRKLPARLYAVYLELMQLLADLGMAEMDMWSMPTAAQLQLPELGTLGLTMSLGDPTIAFELTYENNPGEFLGGFGGIAAIGVMAAIAIPAYQDYTKRAQISEGLAMSGGLKAVVAETYLETGQFPDAERSDEYSVYSDAGKYVDSMIIEPGTGVIIISYYEETSPSGEQVFLEPTHDEQGWITWTCSGTFADKHLPAACRE